MVRLPKDLVDWVDSQADGVNFRNRTHVIEKALSDLKKDIGQSSEAHVYFPDRI